MIALIFLKIFNKNKKKKQVRDLHTKIPNIYEPSKTHKGNISMQLILLIRNDFHCIAITIAKIIAMKAYSTFTNILGFEAHHQIQYSVISRTLVARVVPHCSQRIL